MKKLRKWITMCQMEGKSVRGLYVTPAEIYQLIDIYNVIARKEKPEFISDGIKKVLDKAGIKATVEGIGWRVI